MSITRRRPAPYSLTGPKGRVCEKVQIADTPLSRARGLLTTPDLADTEGLMLVPCDRVHTFGMRYPISAVFCDPDLRVVAVETLSPNTTSDRHDDATVCFEVPPSVAANVEVGDMLRLQRRGIA